MVFKEPSMATKKKTTKRTTRTASKKHTAPMRSFRVEKEQTPFTSFKVTRQTFYWVVLLLVIIATQLWILKLQMDISHLTDLLLIEQ